MDNILQVFFGRFNSEFQLYIRYNFLIFNFPFDNFQPNYNFHLMALSANQMFTLDQISIVNQNSVISTTVWKVKNFPSLKFLKISKVYRFWAKLWIVSRINLIHIFYLNKAYNCVYRQVRNLEILNYSVCFTNLPRSLSHLLMLKDLFPREPRFYSI